MSGLILPSIDSDGKTRVTNTPASTGWRSWFCGAGDQLSPTLVRGGGQRLRLAWTGYEPNETAAIKSVEIQFAEPVELHNGQAVYSAPENWHPDDTFDMYVRMPGTEVVSTPDSGNCNLMNAADYNVIVPAVKGSHTVNLATAVPVAANGSGYWDAHYGTGVVTPSASPGQAGWHLISEPVTGYLIRNMPCGNPHGVFKVDAYLVEWIHPSWKLGLKVKKLSSINGAGSMPGEFSAWIQCFRQKTT